MRFTASSVSPRPASRNPRRTPVGTQARSRAPRRRAGRRRTPASATRGSARPPRARGRKADEPPVRGHDLQRERVLALQDAFERLAAPHAQRDRAEAVRNHRVRLADRLHQRFARASERDTRQVGTDAAGARARAVTVGAALGEQRAAERRVAGGHERRHGADVAQVRDDGPELGVGRHARRHDASRDAAPDRAEHALVGRAAGPERREVRAAIRLFASGPWQSAQRAANNPAPVRSAAASVSNGFTRCAAAPHAARTAPAHSSARRITRLAPRSPAPPILRAVAE